MALARSYESLVLSGMESPSGRCVNRDVFASSRVGLMLLEGKKVRAVTVVTRGFLRSRGGRKGFAFRTYYTK